MNKPTGYFNCFRCGSYWTGDQLYLDPMATGQRWTCGDLTCGANVIELKPETIIKALVERKKSATLTALLREAGLVIKPFADEPILPEFHDDLYKDTLIQVMHFRRAADIQKRIQDVVG